MKGLICLSLLFVFLWSESTFAQTESTYDKTEILKGKSAYISSDKVEINIHGRGDQDQVYKAFEINREVTYHILNGYGLNAFKNYKLPEDFDPTFITHGPAVKNLGIYYSDYKIENFKVVVKRKGRKPFTPKMKKKIINKESFNLDYLYNYSQNSYRFTDLMIGDEVQIKYTIVIPFRENYSRFASYRIFFQDSLPKLKYELTITHDELLDIEMFEFNNAKVRTDFTSERTRKRIWKYENLPGNMAEPGSRAYLELPYITWVINEYKYYVHNTEIQKNIPHYAVISSIRERDLNDILTSIEIGSKSKEFAPFESTFNRMTEGLPKDYTVISELHKKITEEFNYENDIEFYRRNDPRSERLGEHFFNGILRDASRYNLYYAIMVKSGLQTYSAYIIDKRFGEVSDHYFLPNFDNDYLMAVFFGENLTDFILPKRHRYGWYYNELPFYYEETKSRLVHLTDYASFRTSMKELFRSRMTALSEAQNNTRTSSYTVNVDLDADSIHFQGDVDLSGQYSTMCRGVYMNGYKDPTVDRRYTKSLWQLIPFSDLIEKDKGEVSSEYPFKANFENSFKSAFVVKKDEDEYSINLNNFFPHIVPAPLTSQERTLDYYPDFQGLDRFNYEIQFDREVEMINAPSILIENDFMSYEFKAVQINSKSIGIYSAYNCKVKKVNAKDYDDVRQIFAAIKKANEYLLRVK